MNKKSINLEKELQNKLKQEQNQTEAKDKDIEKKSIHNMTPVERLMAIKSGQIAQEPTKEKKVDLIHQNELEMESPLPTTLACDLLPVEKIVNGVIYTEDNRYIRIVEVLPVNFLLKSLSEQLKIVSGFANYLKAAPDHFQILSYSTRADISDMIKQIDEEIRTEKNEGCRDLLLDYKELVKTVGATQSVSRRFFITLEYKKRAGITPTQKEIEFQLERSYSRLQQYIRKCGNKVLLMKSPTEETCKILFELLNRTKSPKSFSLRLQNVCKYYTQNYGKDSLKVIPITEYFAPERINFKNHNYTKINDTYYDYVFISSEGYPLDAVPAGWSALLVNACEGIDVKFDIKKENLEQSKTRINRKIRINKARAKDMSVTSDNYDAMAGSIQSGLYLKQGLTQRNEDLYYFTVLITITAPTLEQLEYKRNELNVYLKTNEIKVRNCDYLQEEALLSYLPLGYMSKSIERRGKRNILTSDLAGLYPFTSFEMNDPNGIFLGINESNDSLVSVDFFNSNTVINGNIAITGSSGLGKTYTTELINTRFRRKGIQTFVIAPDKGHEFKRCCKAIGGEYIKIAPSSTQCINVMEIRPIDNTSNKILDGDDEEDSRLAGKIESLHIFFSLLIPDITAEEEQLLDEALVVTYGKKGITHDNKSLIDPKNPNSYKEMPILEDVYNELIKDEKTVRIANIMNRLVHGSARTFNQQTNVNLDNLYVVIDISPLSGSPLLPVGMYIAIEYVFEKIKEDRLKRKAVVIDEAWEIISTNAKAAEYVLKMFKTIRGYGGSAICATQDLKDFFALENGKYGEGIINNSETKIVLKLKPKEAEKMQEVLDLSDSEVEKITGFERGHGLLSINNNNLSIDFRSSDLEKLLITTDREELTGLKEKLKDRPDLLYKYAKEG